MFLVVPLQMAAWSFSFQSGFYINIFKKATRDFKRGKNNKPVMSNDARVASINNLMNYLVRVFLVHLFLACQMHVMVVIELKQRAKKWIKSVILFSIRQSWPERSTVA
jgi:hypothetical protein